MSKPTVRNPYVNQGSVQQALNDLTGQIERYQQQGRQAVHARNGVERDLQTLRAAKTQLSNNLHAAKTAAGRWQNDVRHLQHEQARLQKQLRNERAELETCVEQQNELSQLDARRKDDYIAVLDKLSDELKQLQRQREEQRLLRYITARSVQQAFAPELETAGGSPHADDADLLPAAHELQSVAEEFEAVLTEAVAAEQQVASVRAMALERHKNLTLEVLLELEAAWKMNWSEEENTTGSRLVVVSAEDGSTGSAILYDGPTVADAIAGRDDNTVVRDDVFAVKNSAAMNGAAGGEPDGAGGGVDGDKENETLYYDAVMHIDESSSMAGNGTDSAATDNGRDAPENDLSPDAAGDSTIDDATYSVSME